MTLMEDCEEHPQFVPTLARHGAECWLRSTAMGGAELRVRVRPDRIDAYTAERPEVIVTRMEDKKIHFEMEEELAELLFREPVMKVWHRDRGPTGEKEYSVDFEAGFQRGYFPYQDKKALCEELPPDLPRITSRDPWLSWIGLNCEPALIKKWLDGFYLKD